MVSKTHVAIASALSLLILAGSEASAKEKKPKEVIQEAPVRVIAVGDTAKPVQLRKVAMRLPRNKKIGSVQIGILCFPTEELTYRGGQIAIDDEQYTDVFRDELESANYTVVGDPDALFDDPGSWKAEYLIGGLIKDMKVNVCYPNAGMGDTVKSKGDGEMDVEWQVYSRLDRKVVLEVKTKGTAKVPTKQNGDEQVVLEAFASASRQLLADESFYNLITGKTPTQFESQTASIATPSVMIGRLPLSNVSFKNQVTMLRAQVVTVFAGDGTGSGFFVSDRHLITNNHVVGGAKFVKVKFVTGREILGEVLTTNSARDVALIQTESSGVTGLPLRLEEPAIGSPIYVVGSPLGQENEGTVSGGIISSYRTEDGQRLL
jgi:serine protease Do